MRNMRVEPTFRVEARGPDQQLSGLLEGRGTITIIQKRKGHPILCFLIGLILVLFILGCMPGFLVGALFIHALLALAS